MEKGGGRAFSWGYLKQRKLAADCKREDALFLGPGGTGKSHLAQAMEVIMRRYERASTLLTSNRREEAKLKACGTAACPRGNEIRL